jgi:hypothetical protein
LVKLQYLQIKDNFFLRDTRYLADPSKARQVEDTDYGDAVRAPVRGAQEKSGGYSEWSIWGEGGFRQ